VLHRPIETAPFHGNSASVQNVHRSDKPINGSSGGKGGTESVLLSRVKEWPATRLSD
jgi:hypothetical protein